jgi:hypothetical protein
VCISGQSLEKFCFQKKKARSMLFSKNLRKLALGLIVATAASMGFGSSANADVYFDLDSRTDVNPAAQLTNAFPPNRFFSAPAASAPNGFVSYNIVGTDFGSLAGYSKASLSFVSAPTGPSTAGPVLPLSVSTFILTDNYNGAGNVILTATAPTASLTVLDIDTVLFEGVGTADIATIGVTGIKFAITFSNINKDLTVGGSTFIPSAWSALSAAGQITTVPEPSSLALLALGGLGLGVRAYRRRKAIVA